MKMNPSPLLGLLALSMPAVAHSEASGPFPPHVLSGTELRVLEPTEQGRHYQLHISLPGSYHSEPERHYPVLFLTDAYWDFPTLVSSYHNLVYDKVVPEIIIVGLGYAGENLDYSALRRWELSPIDLEGYPDSGQAAVFLSTLKDTIIPFVEKHYRADPNHRSLAGSSLGGLFALYALLSEPGLFQAYIAASPATIARSDWIFGYEAERAQSGAPLQGRLFMTGAAYEWPYFLASIRRFDERLASRHHPELAYRYREILGERHAGTKAEAYVRGLRYIYAPIAPETGPDVDPEDLL